MRSAEWGVYAGFNETHCCHFVRIALTRAQIQSARWLERLSIGVKPSDSRSERYIAEHGRRCWEVDILPQAAIRAFLDVNIKEWLDQKTWDRRVADIERGRELL
jgi:hypothetical protein